MKELINKRLQILEPILLEITDESEHHKGHAGYKEGGETHFNLKIVSHKFTNLKLVERHRLVKNILAEELESKIHALSMKTVSISEYISEQLSLLEASQNNWAQIAFVDRIKILLKIRDYMKNNLQSCAELITKEMGKIPSEATAEVEKCLKLIDYYVENGERFLATEVVSSDFSKSYITYEPLGIVFGIMPWNFPFWQVFRFAVPSILAGNVVALKHSSIVPECSQKLEEIFNSTEHKVFKSFLIDAESAAEVIKDSRISAVTITGSTEAGRKVASIAGSNLKKVVLELGGSDPYIILEDANIDLAVEKCAIARLQNAGQSCIAGKRFIVLSKIHDEFCAKLKLRFNQEPKRPLVSEEACKNIKKIIDQALEEGANLLTGGNTNSNYLEPTILSEITEKMYVANLEIFGPVALIFKVENEEEAIRVANSTEFGLGAAIFSKNISRAESLASKIRSGSVFINDFVKSNQALPFGGIKNSGYGRELSIYGIREFVNVKTVVVG